MWLLAASILALGVGPVLVRGVGGRPGLLALVDGFVLVTLLGLVLVHIMPESVMGGGAIGGVAAMVGLVVPATLERRLDDRGRVSAALLWGAIAGLAAHAMLDGAALAATGLHAAAAHERLLAWAVLLHRVPFGITLWWLVRPRLGGRASLGMVTLIAVATVVGYALAGTLLGTLPARALAVLQGLVAGSLLHVVVGHQPASLHAASVGKRLFAAAGALAALAVLAALSAAHEAMPSVAGAAASGRAALALARAMAPAALLTVACTAVMCGLWRPPAPRSLGKGAPLGRLVRALSFGLPLPLSSCDVLPLHRRLVAAGVGSLASVTVLLATPQLGLGGLLVGLPLLGAPLAVARWLAAAAMVLLLAPPIAMLARRAATSGRVVAAAGLTRPTRAQRLRAGLRFALGDYLDHMSPWLVAGLLIASLTEPLLDPRLLPAVPPSTQAACCALLGTLLFVPVVGALPIAAVLLHKGMSPGAALALLISAPAASPRGVQSVSRHHGRRAAAALVVGVAAAALLVGLVVDRAAPAWPLLGLHQTPRLGGAPWRDGALAVVAVLVLASVLRQGPRAAVAKVAHPREHRDRHARHGHDA